MKGVRKQYNMPIVCGYLVSKDISFDRDTVKHHVLSFLQSKSILKNTPTWRMKRYVWVRYAEIIIHNDMLDEFAEYVKNKENSLADN